MFRQCGAMEACIVICRTKKPESHRGSILFVNAVNEVTRKNSQGYLESSHLKRITKAYQDYKSEDGFAKKISISEIEQNDFSLNISLYAPPAPETTINQDNKSLQDCYNEWKKSSLAMRICYNKLNNLLEVSEQI